MNPNNSQNPVAREYHARVNTPTGNLVSIKGSSLAEVQKDIQHVLGGAPRFDIQNNPSTKWIFSDSYLKGTQPCGTLVEIEVPAVLSTKQITDQRMAAQRAA